MKPTVTNARYRVVERKLGYSLFADDVEIGGALPSRIGLGWFWELSNSYSHGTAPTAQAAMDALVAAYETGNGEAGE